MDNGGTSASPCHDAYMELSLAAAAEIYLFFFNFPFLLPSKGF